MTSAAALSASLTSRHLALPSLLTSRLKKSRRSCAAAPSISSTLSSSTLPASGVQISAGAAGFRENQRLWRANAQSDGASGSPKTEEQPPSATEATPSWAKPGSEELPPWAKNEAAAPTGPSEDLPFFVYLIASCLVAIAAVGSVFEFFNRNPVFGVVQPDNPLWAPILGFFAITGIPSAGFLWYKAIKLANKASEEADRADGFDR